MTAWLTDWLTDWRTDWLTDWLTDRPTDRLADSLTDWLNDWLLLLARIPFFYLSYLSKPCLIISYLGEVPQAHLLAVINCKKNVGYNLPYQRAHQQQAIAGGHVRIWRGGVGAEVIRSIEKSRSNSSLRSVRRSASHQRLRTKPLPRATCRRSVTWTDGIVGSESSSFSVLIALVIRKPEKISQRNNSRSMEKGHQFIYLPSIFTWQLL